jgi:hypothetical protein
MPSHGPHERTIQKTRNLSKPPNPFSRKVEYLETAATDVWADSRITSAIAPELPCGMGSDQFSVTGMTVYSSKSIQVPTKARNSAPTGNVSRDAATHFTMRSTFVRGVETPPTVPIAALLGNKSLVSTPLQADKWEQELQAAKITHKYPHLVHSIRYGFYAGIPPIHSTFSPPNNISDIISQSAFDTVMAKEIELGRWIGPFSQTELEKFLGPFQTSPITMIPKPGKPGKFRLLENLSYPYYPRYNYTANTTIRSINSHIDSLLYPCLWGTFTNTCTLIWTLPPGSQGAVRDISEAYRLIPLHPSQWPGATIRVGPDKFCADLRNMFGLSSAGGIFGHLADAGMDISRARGLGPVSKWVDDHFWIRILRRWLTEYNSRREKLKRRITNYGGQKHKRGRIYYEGDTLPDGRREEFDDDFEFPIQDLSSASPRSADDSQYTYCFADINAVTDPLGYTWALEKDIPFGNTPIFFGFEWNLSEKQVSVPRSKRDKYITAITEWQTRSKHSLNDAEKLYGKLMHVCLVFPRGRSYLVELERLLADLKHAAPFATHKPPAASRKT